MLTLAVGDTVAQGGNTGTIAVAENGANANSIFINVTSGVFVDTADITITRSGGGAASVTIVNANIASVDRISVTAESLPN